MACVFLACLTPCSPPRSSHLSLPQGLPGTYGQHAITCGNGGLSIRSRDVIIKTLTAFPPDQFGPPGPEDGWYCKWLPYVGAKVAPFGIASQWASELWWLNRHSVGFHQLNADAMRKVQAHCPEVSLLGTGRN